MSDDESLARMLREADAVVRERQRAEAPRPPPPPEPPTPAPAVTSGAVDRPATWWRVDVPLWDVTFLGPVVVLALVVLGGLGALLGARSLALLGGLAAGLAVAALVGAWRWLRFRTWRTRLGFALVGWAELVDAEGFDRDERWRHAELTVTHDGKADVEALLRAALELFARDAGRAFYECEGADERRPWIARGASATGSVNRHVTRHLKALAEERLALIHRKTGAIRALTIAVHGEPFEARRPRGEDG